MIRADSGHNSSAIVNDDGDNIVGDSQRIQQAATRNQSSSHVDRNIDPSLSSHDAQDDDATLRKTYLSFLPTEKLVTFIFKLIDYAPPSVLAEIWPTNLKDSVLEVAVAAIVANSSNNRLGAADGERNTGLGSLKALGIDLPSKESQKTTDSAETNGGTASSSSEAAATTTNGGTTTTNAEAGPSSSARASPPPVTPRPPHSLPRPPPPSAFQHSPSPQLFNSPFASGTFSYQASTFNQAYFAPSPPPPPPIAGPSHSSPIPPPPPPPANLHSIQTGPNQDDDDLPSYEDMIVQALIILNDPNGVAPKQLFQWMAATYPLQANFRPSASQALQKAFKRGRFEKNHEGKYRLNAAWLGGHSARRTTRRPQSYTKAVTNPNPSSHQPANSHQFPPHHFTWSYGPATVAKNARTSESRSPVPHQLSPPEEPVLSAAEAEQQARESMEAAYSILQALNMAPAPEATNGDAITPSGAPQPGESAETETSPATGGKEKRTAATKTTKTAAPAVPPPIFAADIDLALPTPPPTTSTAPEDQNTRSQLQGALALLAAQLAEIASSVPNAAAAETLESLGLDTSAWALSLDKDS